MQFCIPAFEHDSSFYSLKIYVNVRSCVQVLHICLLVLCLYTLISGATVQFDQGDYSASEAGPLEVDVCVVISELPGELQCDLVVTLIDLPGTFTGMLPTDTHSVV